MATQVYFSPDFYDCIVATAAGESPATEAGSWQAVWIPHDFQDALVALASASILTGQKQFEMAQDQMTKGAMELGRLINDSTRRYGSPRPLRVVDREN